MESSCRIPYPEVGPRLSPLILVIYGLFFETLIECFISFARAKHAQLHCKTLNFKAIQTAYCLLMLMQGPRLTRSPPAATSSADTLRGDGEGDGGGGGGGMSTLRLC